MTLTIKLFKQSTCSILAFSHDISWKQFLSMSVKQYRKYLGPWSIERRQFVYDGSHSDDSLWYLVAVLLHGRFFRKWRSEIWQFKHTNRISSAVIIDIESLGVFFSELYLLVGMKLVFEPNRLLFQWPLCVLEAWLCFSLLLFHRIRTFEVVGL